MLDMMPGEGQMAANDQAPALVGLPHDYIMTDLSKTRRLLVFAA